MIKSNIFSGLTVGIIALPLSMALAIATGVPPQLGLYTAIVAGILAAIFGSSKVNISGPTAAFIVILIPIVQQFGITGLLLCGFLSGIILVLVGLFKLGNLIELVPYPVTVGFTSGIAVVIATLQIKDFFGLTIENFSGTYIDKIVLLFNSFSTFNLFEFLTASATLFLLIIWRKTKSKIPAALVALGVVSIFVAFFNSFYGLNISTINSTFTYVIDGVTANGIPPKNGTTIFAIPWPINSLFGSVLFPVIASLITAHKSDSKAPKIAIAIAWGRSFISKSIFISWGFKNSQGRENCKGIGGIPFAVTPSIT